MSSRATSRSRRTRTRNRSPKAQAEAQRRARPASGGRDRASRPSGAAAGADRATWERELNRLRRVSRLLGLVLVTVLVRIVIHGPTLLSGLTAVVILALLLASLRLRRQGQRLQRSGGPAPTGTTSDRQPKEGALR